MEKKKTKLAERSILLEEKVKAVCELLQDGYSFDEIVEKIPNTCKRWIANIKYGESWKDISKNYNFPISTREGHSEEQVRKVCDLLEKGYSFDKIMKLVPNVSKSWIAKIKYKEVWTSISDNYNLSSLVQKRHSEEQVRKVCELLEKGYSSEEIMRLVPGIKKRWIEGIKYREKWTSISKDYKW